MSTQQVYLFSGDRTIKTRTASPYSSILLSSYPTNVRFYRVFLYCLWYCYFSLSKISLLLPSTAYTTDDRTIFPWDVAAETTWISGVSIAVIFTWLHNTLTNTRYTSELASYIRLLSTLVMLASELYLTIHIYNNNSIMGIARYHHGKFKSFICQVHRTTQGQTGHWNY